MMTLWSIFRSPLIIGGEMTGFDEFTMSLLTNEAILGMHRNARHSHQVWRKEIRGIEHILWTAVNAEGGQYFAVFNVGEADSEIEIALSELEIYEPVTGRELWSGETISEKDVIQVNLKSHGAKAYYVKCK